MATDISSLADYSALKKLAAALWRQDNAYHGAAVMVGAGFSRSAAMAGDINGKLPLWNDFSTTLAKELDSVTTDPLRLAEEYCAYFGRQALYDLIKIAINDAAWTPGEMHKHLLELPWTEVLTTNWDSLLERAAMAVHQPLYNVVSKQEDLSNARPPRIVKLHGTVDVTENLIFTQEDYRRYPQHHAAFVNFARQVFIENELCLLGFSGDDPNFLQWAGWVRDYLATHSRRIYLVGALGLNSAKRKYLESINVSPIDLSELVSDYDDSDARHEAAAEVFIEALQNLKPAQAWEWSPIQLHRATLSQDELDGIAHNTEKAAKRLEGQLKILEADRKSYPKWLVCPTKQRWELQTQINDPSPTPKNLAELEDEPKAKILYEIAWRYSITYEAIPLWLAHELFSICDPSKPCALTKRQQLEVALVLMKNTRWFEDHEFRSMEKATSNILYSNAKYWPEATNELLFHQAILARDEFDYDTLEKNLNQIFSNDPTWKLKKASLFAELGQFTKGEDLIAEAYREFLDQHRKHQDSIYIFSRLAWAHWIIRGVELWTPGREFKAFPSVYQDSKCSPWDHIEHIRERVSKELVKQQRMQSIEPSFEPGRFKDNSNTLSFSSELHPLLLLEGISRSVGLPFRWNGVSFLAESTARLTELEDIQGTHRFSLAIRSATSDTSDVLKKVFSRMNVACLSETEVNYLLNNCMQAINYWTDKRTSQSGELANYPVDRLRIFIEVLARVTVRATAEQAKESFYVALSLGNNPQLRHLWLFNPISHLIKFALESIPEEDHFSLLPGALFFPLQTEIGIKDHTEWPNPVIGLPGVRTHDAALDRRIDEIIDSIAPCSSSSAPALLRLMPLIESNFLTEAECVKIGAKIWESSPEYRSLPDTGLWSAVLLALPSPNNDAVETLVRSCLFEAKGSDIFDRLLLNSLVSAAQNKNITNFPTETQASSYFEQLVSWRASHSEKDIFGFSKQEEMHLAGLIGEVLSRSVVPVLSPEVLTEDNFNKLSEFYISVESPEALTAFVYFAAANHHFVERVRLLVRKGLQSKDPKELAYSSYALLKWRDLAQSTATDGLTSRLIYLIGANRLIGLPALLWTVNEMYNNEYLRVEDIESLEEFIPVIFDNNRYSNISPYSRESVSVSLVRAACVRMARDIANRNKDKNIELVRVLEEAKLDPLPEVRFA